MDECLDFWEDNATSEYQKEIIDSVDRSLQIDSTPFNRAWLLKCDYIKHVYEKDRDKAKSEIKEVLATISGVKSKNLSSAYESYYKLLGIEEKKCEAQLRDLYDYSLKADNLAFVEHCAISLMNFYMKLNRFEDFEKFVNEYEEEFIPSEDFVYNKAIAYIKCFAKFEKAEEIINNSNKSSRWKKLMFDYFCYTNQKERAERVLNRFFSNDTMRLVRFYSMCDDEKIIEMLENYWDANPHTLSDVSMYACACLKHNQAAKAYRLCKHYYDNPDYYDGVLYINYFLADQAYNNKDVSAKVRGKIIEKKDLYPDIVLAGAYALVNDRNNMYSSLTAAIKENILYKFDIMSWPAFDKYKNDEKFIKLADVSALMNFERKIENY